MFSAPDSVSFDCCMRCAVRFPSLRSADINPGTGSLVGREFAQSLGTRLLVSVLRGAGATRNVELLWCLIFNCDKSCIFILLLAFHIAYGLL